MTRVKRGKITVRQRKKKLNQTKGYRGAWSTLSRPMFQISLKSSNYSYQHRRKRGNIFRKILILRSNALIRSIGLPVTYKNLVYILRKNQCQLNRNILNQLSTRDSNNFLKLIQYILKRS